MQPEHRDVPIEPNRGSHFYQLLPARADHLEGATLSTALGRMQATKNYLIETFRGFEGSVIYPCALADMRSTLDLHKLFPKARLVLNDLIDPKHISNKLHFGDRPNDTDTLIEYLSKRFLFDPTSEWKDRHEIENLTFTVKHRDDRNPVFGVSFGINTSTYKPDCVPDFLSGVSTVTFEYRVTDFFNDAGISPGIVFLRRPGWQGSFMRDAKLWNRVNDLVGDSSYLLVATDQGYREGAHFIAQSFEPLLIDHYIDQIRPPLPLFSIGGVVPTQVFMKREDSHISS